MAYAARHAGKVDDKGMLILADPTAWRAACARHRNRQVWVTVVRQQHNRSMQANKYYWAVVVETVAAYIGETREETHALLKAYHLPSRSIETLEGKILDGVPPTTRTLSVEQFSQYVERVKVWAATYLGLSIPDANQVEVAL